MVTHEPRSAVEVDLPELPLAVIASERDNLPVPRGVGWRVGVLGLAIIYVGMIVCVLVDATTPSGYRGAHLAPGEVWSYPTDDVHFSITAMTIEFAITALGLYVKTQTTIWTRSALFAALYFFAMVFFAFVSMHATRPIFDHVAYLFFGCGFLIAFAIGAGIAGSVVRQRRLDRAGL